MKIKLISLLILLTLAFSTNPWGGISVSNADNLDALTLNPAGLAVKRGEQSGFYIPLDQDKPFSSAFSAGRSDGFGYSLNYLDGNSIFNPNSGTIGVAGKIFNNFYMGASWNKNTHGTYLVIDSDGEIVSDKSLWEEIKTNGCVDINYTCLSGTETENTIKIGSIYRPFNFLSFGDNLTFSEELDSIYNYRAGLSFRPFLKHRLTIGSDVILKNGGNNKFTETIMPFISIQPLNGVKLSASTSLNNNDNSFSNININLELNFGHGGVYTTAEDKQIGIGFTTYTQQDETVLNIKKKDHDNYVRMNLKGKFIEEKPKDMGLFSFFAEAPGVQLRKWIDQINELADDDNLDGLIIDLGSVSAGFATRNTIRRTLQAFKNTGKKIIVFSEYGISNSAYFLISMADEIYIPEMTDVGLKGLSVNISFYRGLLDTLSIVPEIFRVNYDGKSYKTAGDSFLNHEMSDEMRENYSELFEDLFTVFVNGISEGRGWDADKTMDIINNGPYIITQNAIDAGLVTGTMYPDEFEDYIKELNNEKNNITKWVDIDRSDNYVHEWAPEEKDKIAVIYAVGGIQSGKSNPGPAGSTIMGDKTIMEAIKSAREDESIKAIVLRINSGGGSALASDHMWSEIIKTTKTDTSNIKPFIASMSDVAASGGYYIACEADSILADEATITGSIGVIGLRFNFSQLKKRIGINQESLMFGENSDFMSSARLINDDEYKRLQASIDDVYTRFKTRVIEGRHNLTDEDDLDAVALGRVFTGKKASELELTLVDKFGGLHEAIEVAKNSASIEGEVEIVEFPRKMKSKNGFSVMLGAKVEKQIGELLPKEIRDDWEYLRSIEGLMDESTLMIFPYKIDIE